MDEERKLYLPYLLSALDRAAFEGELALMEGDVERKILFRGGKPINVMSRLQEETLGHILLDEGKISPDDYSHMLDMMVQTKQRAGEVLIAMGILGPQDVYTALEFQTRRKLLNCFKMVDFGFALEEKSVPVEKVISSLDLSSALFTGILDAYSADRLLTEFPVDEESFFQVRTRSFNRPVKMGPRESKILRTIGKGVALVKLMNVEEDLRLLLSVLYGLHALDMVMVSGVARPSTRDLELAALKDEGVDDLVEDFVQSPEESISPSLAEEDETTGEFRSPTLIDALSKGQMDPKLAKKVLKLDQDDYFEVLEVNRRAREQELKSAYYKLLRTYKLQDIDTSYRNEGERDVARRLLDKATFAYRELSEDSTRVAYLQSLKSHRARAEHEVSPRILADVEAQKGELAVGAKRYQEAMELFDTAIGLYPDEPSYHFKFGLASYFRAMEEIPIEQPLPDQVRKPFLKAIAIDPSYDQARLYLGYISKRNGDFSRALKEFQSALECNPKNQRAQSEIRLLKRRLDSNPLPGRKP